MDNDQDWADRLLQEAESIAADLHSEFTQIDLFEEWEDGMLSPLAAESDDPPDYDEDPAFWIVAPPAPMISMSERMRRVCAYAEEAGLAGLLQVEAQLLQQREELSAFFSSVEAEWRSPSAEKIGRAIFSVEAYDQLEDHAGSATELMKAWAALPVRPRLPLEARHPFLDRSVFHANETSNQLACVRVVRDTLVRSLRLPPFPHSDSDDEPRRGRRNSDYKIICAVADIARGLPLESFNTIYSIGTEVDKRNHTKDQRDGWQADTISRRLEGAVSTVLGETLPLSVVDAEEVGKWLQPRIKRFEDEGRPKRIDRPAS